MSDSLLEMPAAINKDLRWGAGASVVDRLVECGRAFNFYQATRVLSIVAAGGKQAGSDEVLVRFCSKMGFDFPGSDIERIELQSGAHSLPKMTVNFLGLGGAHGPIPVAYTPQLLLERDSALRDFLDIFNHRLVCFAYRIHALHHPELTRCAPSQGLIANLLFAVFGLDRDPESSIRNVFSIQDRALLDYSGLLAHGAHSASGLERLIQDYFRIPASIEQFTGTWLSLDRDQWTELGTAVGRNHVLGENAIVGRRVWDEHAGITIQLGPLDLPTFKSFLPEGHSYKLFRDLVRFYLRDEFEITLKLVLRADQTPSAFASSSALPQLPVQPAVLGRLAWLKGGHAAVIDDHKTKDANRKGVAVEEDV